MPVVGVVKGHFVELNDRHLRSHRKIGDYGQSYRSNELREREIWHYSKTVKRDITIFLYLFPGGRDSFFFSINNSRPLRVIGRRASISHSVYSLFACSETVIKLKRMHSINRASVFWFGPQQSRASCFRSPLTENVRALENVVHGWRGGVYACSQ